MCTKHVIQRLAAILLAGVLAIGCDMSQPAVTTQPKGMDGRAAESQSASSGTSKPAASQPVSQPTSDASKPTEEPKLPPYLKILEQIEPGKANIEVELSGEQRIALHTLNVKRFSITRKDSPLARDRSVALRIDGTNLEWTPKRQTLTLERASNGDWLTAEDRAKPVSETARPEDAPQYVSRAGAKLAAALDAFDVSVAGWTVADFGSHVGGFVDCLLQRGAARVYAVDPGYGVLDYRLRRDTRVVVRERTNALRFVCPEPCHCVTIDTGWTPQRLILPAAARALRPDGCVLTLIKPHYEAADERLSGGVLQTEHLEEVLVTCRRDVASLGWTIAGEIESPIRGHGGNVEFVWWLRRA